MRWAPPALEPPPDPALARAFAGCLPGGRVAGPLLAFAAVSSTQAVARDLAERGAPEGLVVLADVQTQGRGQRGRIWSAPAGAGLLVSCLLRPAHPAGRWPELTLAAAGAIVEAVEAVAGLTARVKWPNDVLVGDRKLAGVLAEGVVGPSVSASFVVLGLGINVGQGPEDWPPDLRATAVSLVELGYGLGRPALLAAVLDRLARRYVGFLQGSPARDPAGRAAAGEG